VYTKVWSETVARDHLEHDSGSVIWTWVLPVMKWEHSSIMLFFPLMLQNPSNWTESLTHWLLGIFFLRQTPVWLLF